jgi:hypothetical protein
MARDCTKLLVFASALVLVLMTAGNPAMGARVRVDAEGPLGHASCADGLDNDADGTVNESGPCAQAVAFATCTGGFCARAEDGILWGNAEIFADSTSPSGNAVRLKPGAIFGSGGVRLCGTNFAINPGFMQLYARSTQAVAWIRLDSTHPQTLNNATDAMLIPNLSAYGWTFTNKAASIPARTIAADQLAYNLSGAGQHCFDIAIDPGLILFAAFVANSINTVAVLPAGGGTPTPDYTVLRVNTLSEGSMDGQCAQSDWAANEFIPFHGVNQLAGDATGRITKTNLLWKPGPPTRLCACFKVDDTDRRFFTMTNDDPSMFTAQNDRVEFLTDTNPAALSLSSTSVKVAFNTAPVYYDANYPGGVAAVSYGTNRTFAKFSDGTKWGIEACWDLGATKAAGDLIKFNAKVVDQDDMAAVAQVSGQIGEFDNLAKAFNLSLSNSQPAADSTAPVLSGCSVVGTPDTTSATLRCNVSEASFCWATLDTVVNGSISVPPEVQTAEVPSQSGVCTVSPQNLMAGTTYEYKLRAHDPSGNISSGEPVSTFTTASAQAGCNYFVSNNGSGNCLAQGTPCKFSDIWALGQATLQGKTICALDGTYQGANNMLTPTPGISGTSTSRITVKAYNDGGVTIDGQNARLAVWLSNNSYWTIEGIDACCVEVFGHPNKGDEGTVWLIDTGSNNNIIRRAVGWKASPNINDAMIFGNHHNTGNLIEDAAGFGTARKVFDCAQGGDNCTYRRIWGRWEGSFITGPKHTIEHTYNNYNMKIENAILTWSAEKMGGAGIDQNYGMEAGGGVTSVCQAPPGQSCPPYNLNNNLYGSIIYQTGNETGPTPNYNVFFSDSTVSGITLTDTVSYVPSNRGQYALFAAQMYTGDNAAGTNISKFTSIGGGQFISSSWNVTSLVRQSTLSGINIWTATQGANLCNRYINGVRQSTPLWPWPMNARIKAALAKAGYADQVDVQATMESIFGAIPAQCKG